MIKRNKAAQRDLEDKLRAAEASAAAKQQEIAALKRNQQENYSVLLDTQLSKPAKQSKIDLLMLKKSGLNQRQIQLRTYPRSSPAERKWKVHIELCRQTLVMPYLQIQLRLPTIHEKTANLFH